VRFKLGRRAVGYLFTRCPLPSNKQKCEFFFQSRHLDWVMRWPNMKWPVAIGATHKQVRKRAIRKWSLHHSSHGSFWMVRGYWTSCFRLGIRPRSCIVARFWRFFTLNVILVFKVFSSQLVIHYWHVDHKTFERYWLQDYICWDYSLFCVYVFLC